jgi:hypothetical protein
VDRFWGNLFTDEEDGDGSWNIGFPPLNHLTWLLAWEYFYWIKSPWNLCILWNLSLSSPASCMRRPQNNTHPCWTVWLTHWPTDWLTDRPIDWLTDSPTDWLTPWSGVLLTLTVPQLVKNFPAYYGAWRSISLFMGACHLLLFWARLI